MENGSSSSKRKTSVYLSSDNSEALSNLALKLGIESKSGGVPGRKGSISGLLAYIAELSLDDENDIARCLGAGWIDGEVRL